MKLMTKELERSMPEIGKGGDDPRDDIFVRFNPESILNTLQMGHRIRWAFCPRLQCLTNFVGFVAIKPVDRRELRMSGLHQRQAVFLGASEGLFVRKDDPR